MMKVLALEFEPSGTRGGQEHSLLDVCGGLAAAGHAVTLAHVKDGDLLARYRAAGIRTLPVRGYSIDRTRPLRSAADVAVSVARVLRAQPDAVYINQYQDSLFAATVARLLRVPLVCHLRVFPPSEFCGQWRIGLTGVSRFIAVSEATRQAYVARGFDAAAIELVMNGIDIERFRRIDFPMALRATLGLDLDDYVVLYVGRIDRAKNLEGLLRSFAALHAVVPKARLLVAGRPLNHDGPAAAQAYMTSLKQFAISLGVGAAVRWLGPRTDAVQLYNAADVSALPSNQPETFGRTLTESMACGTPAIGTAVGGVPEVLVGEAQRFVVPAGDDHALSARLRELAGWRDRDPGLGARLRALVVEHFDSRRMVRQIADVLARTAAEGMVRRGPRRLRMSATH